MDIYNKILLVILGILIIYSATNIKNFKWISEDSQIIFELLSSVLGSIIIVISLDMIFKLN